MRHVATAAGLACPAAIVLAVCGAIVVAGCGASQRHAPATSLPSDYQPLPIGRGPAFRLPALSRPVAARRPIGGLRCTRAHRRAYGIHLELYARRLVVPIPAGVGVAPPVRRRGVYVLGGACTYPVRSLEPTGLFAVDSGAAPTLGILFDVWGQQLSERALARFRGSVWAFVGGRRWRRSPRLIPLRRHAEIVLEVGGYVIPHRAYRFPPGL